MKRLLKAFSLLVLVLTLTFVSGCEFTPTRKVSVIAPSGTPVLALGGLFNDDNDIEIVTDTTLLQTALINNGADVVICPLTMGTNLYLKGKSTFKLEAIITTNNAYLISNSPITKEALVGKTIVGFNENNTPGIMLKMYIEQAGINCNTQFEANVNQTVNAFSTGLVEYAVVSEPQLTRLKNENPNLNVVNLGDYVSDKFVPQAAVFVNSKVCEDENVKHFLKELKDNIKYMNKKPSEYVNEVMENHKYFSTIGKEVLIQSIPTTGVDYLKASKYKDTINEFYQNIDKYANNMFEGKTPGEDFYN